MKSGQSVLGLKEKILGVTYSVVARILLHVRICMGVIK